MARKSSKASSPKASSTPSPKKRAAPTKAPTVAKSTKAKAPREGADERPVGTRGRSLVIVESPKKARSISLEFLPRLQEGFVRQGEHGARPHDLPQAGSSASAMIQGYAPSYEIMATKKDTISDLKREAAKASTSSTSPPYRPGSREGRGDRLAPSRRRLDLPDERVRQSSLLRNHRRGHPARRSTHVGPIDMDKVNSASPAGPRPLRRLRTFPAPLEEGRPSPQRREGAIGRRPPDRRAREGDQGVHLRGVLADPPPCFPPPARPGSWTGSPPSWRPGKARNSRARPRTTPEVSATPWPRAITRWVRSRRSRSSTSPTPRSRRVHSSNRPPSASDSLAQRTSRDRPGSMKGSTSAATAHRASLPI